MGTKWRLPSANARIWHVTNGISNCEKGVQPLGLFYHGLEQDAKMFWIDFCTELKLCQVWEFFFLYFDCINGAAAASDQPRSTASQQRATLPPPRFRTGFRMSFEIYLFESMFTISLLV
jgi:hypothetical protein